MHVWTGFKIDFEYHKMAGIQKIRPIIFKKGQTYEGYILSQVLTFPISYDGCLSKISVVS